MYKTVNTPRLDTELYLKKPKTYMDTPLLMEGDYCCSQIYKADDCGTIVLFQPELTIDNNSKC